MRITHDHQQTALPAAPQATHAVTPAQTEAAAQADRQAAPCADEHAYAVHRGIDWYAAYKRASIEATDTGDTADTKQHHLCADSPSPAPAATTVACDAPPTSEPAQSTPPPRAKTILEMTDAELQALPAERKRALLASLGVAQKHLTKTKGAKLDAAFSQAVGAMKRPGQHKLTLKLDKKYELRVRVGSDGAIVDAAAKQKKGFFAKLGSVLKLAAPILGIVLAPLTGGLSLVISSALGAIEAAKNKNWLGMVASVAGAFVPGTGSFLSSAVGAAGKTAALAGQTVARVASVVQQGAYAAQAAMMALRAKSPGALLGAIAGGVGAVAGGMGEAGERLARMGERLQTWSRVVGGGEQVLRAVRSKDYLGAAAGALGTAAGLTKGEVSQNLARYRGWVSSASSVEQGLRTRNYLAATQGGLGLARDLRQPLAGLEPNKHDRVGERLEQAMRLVQGASYLAGAVKRKEAAGIAQAGLMLGGAAASISGRYVAEGGVGSSKDGKSKVSEGLYRAARMVGWTEQAARAAKMKDYAGAAAASLGLAAEASEDQRYATAERIAEGAAGLVTALRSGNTAGIQAATSALMEGVEAERTKARAEQQGLIKDGVQAASRRGQASQPSATKMAQLPDIKAVSVDELLPRLVPLELPSLVSRAASTPLVDVASLGEPPAPPPSRTTGQARTTTHSAPQTLPEVDVDAILSEIGPPPLPPGVQPDAALAGRYGVKQMIDTSRINAAGTDLGRAVARQGLVQLGLSERQADKYLSENPAVSYRGEHGTGAAVRDEGLRAEVGSGRVESTLTPEMWQQIEQFRQREDVRVLGGASQTAAAPISSAAPGGAASAPLPAGQEGTGRMTSEKGELLLDLTQVGLDIAGIIDPTPLSDGASGIISLGRGDLFGAGISGIGILLPVLGDLAKVGKLSKFVTTIGRAVEVAKTDQKFAESIRPLMQRLKGGLDSIPMEKLPGGLREPVEQLKRKVDEFFQRTRRNVQAHEATPVNPRLGHTIEQHVGRSESWLRGRLERESKLDFASSFRNEAVANRVQGQFVKQNREAMAAWLKSGKSKLEGEVTMRDPIGIVVERGKGGMVETQKAHVVLIRDNSLQGWHFRTSYPVK